MNRNQRELSWKKYEDKWILAYSYLLPWALSICLEYKDEDALEYRFAYFLYELFQEKIEELPAGMRSILRSFSKDMDGESIEGDFDALADIMMGEACAYMIGVCYLLREKSALTLESILREKYPKLPSAHTRLKGTWRVRFSTFKKTYVDISQTIFRACGDSS